MFTKNTLGFSNENREIELQTMLCPCCGQPIHPDQEGFREKKIMETPPIITKILTQLNGRHHISYDEFKKIVMFTRPTKDDVDDVIDYLYERNMLKRQSGKLLYIL